MHTCALRPDGSADCWGDNFYGQATDQVGPYTAITAGLGQTCALYGAARPVEASLGEGPVDRSAPDLETLGNLGRTDAQSVEGFDCVGINAWLTLL